MWIIVGLGNPGSKYTKTRHNIGFVALEDIAERHGIEFKERELYRIGKGSIGDKDIILVEPLTFMNRSGIAVRDVMRRFNALPDYTIVIHDDIDMETGKLKLRKNGSSGGHNGVESIIQAIGTNEFIRVKIGVGREEGMAAEDYVLRKFRKEEVPMIRDAVHRAADAVEVIIKHGIEKAMNSFN